MSQRPKWLKMTLAPFVALAATVVVSLMGTHSLVLSSDALKSEWESADSARDLAAIAASMRDINGNLYHVLTLRAAQTKGFDAEMALKKLMSNTDQVTLLLRAWRDRRATPSEKPCVDEMVASVQRYRGTVDFVSQMLDVDFATAVSFVKPFDKNFKDLMQTVNTLVQGVEARRRSDANAALMRAATTVHAFEAVGLVSVMLALAAAANMGWASIRSHQLTRQYSVLRDLVLIDALTGLGNRRCFDDALAASWASCIAEQVPLTLVMLDIDYFKKFNDSQGHPAGDMCLRQVATAIATCTRGATDTVARYGGEEFAIILPGSSANSGVAVAKRAREAVAACAIPHPAAGPPGMVTVSLGVASTLPTASGNPSSLIKAADKCLYAAKKSGRNRVHQDVGGKTNEKLAA